MKQKVNIEKEALKIILIVALFLSILFITKNESLAKDYEYGTANCKASSNGYYIVCVKNITSKKDYSGKLYVKDTTNGKEVTVTKTADYDKNSTIYYVRKDGKNQKYLDKDNYLNIGIYSLEKGHSYQIYLNLENEDFATLEVGDIRLIEVFKAGGQGAHKVEDLGQSNQEDNALLTWVAINYANLIENWNMVKYEKVNYQNKSVEGVGVKIDGSSIYVQYRDSLTYKFLGANYNSQYIYEVGDEGNLVSNQNNIIEDDNAAEIQLDLIFYQGKTLKYTNEIEGKFSAELIENNEEQQESESKQVEIDKKVNGNNDDDVDGSLYKKVNITIGTAGSGSLEDPLADSTLEQDTYDPTNEPSAITDLSMIGTMLGTINTVGVIIAVIVLTVIGVKYMIGSVEEKAEYKETLKPYLLGVFMLAGGTTFLNVLYQLAQTLIT